MGTTMVGNLLGHIGEDSRITAASLINSPIRFDEVYDHLNTDADWYSKKISKGVISYFKKH